MKTAISDTQDVEFVVVEFVVEPRVNQSSGVAYLVVAVVYGPGKHQRAETALPVPYRTREAAESSARALRDNLALDRLAAPTPQ